MEILEYLESIGVTVAPKLIGGYENFDAIQPRHYELWFAPGEPRSGTGE
jgi:hypothetical protein